MDIVDGSGFWHGSSAGAGPTPPPPAPSPVGGGSLLPYYRSEGMIVLKHEMERVRERQLQQDDEELLVII